MHMKMKHKQLEENAGKPRKTTDERKEIQKARKDSKNNSSPVGPWVLGLLVFVVLGSSLLSIIQHVRTSPSMSDS